MNNCFTQINKKSTIRKKLLEFCENGEWVDPPNGTGTFLQKKPSEELIFEDPFLEHVCKNCMSPHGFLYSVTIFMIKPWTHYMLHSDFFRSASVNLLINDYTDSISYFKVSDTYNKLHFDIKELQYEQDYYYLFNSKIPHAVTNRNAARYVLSISLNDDYDTTYKYFNDQLFL